MATGASCSPTLDDLNQVKAEDVLRAANRYLVATGRTTVYTVPPGQSARRPGAGAQDGRPAMRTLAGVLLLAAAAFAQDAAFRERRRKSRRYPPPGAAALRPRALLPRRYRRARPGSGAGKRRRRHDLAEGPQVLRRCVPYRCRMPPLSRLPTA